MLQHAGTQAQQPYQHADDLQLSSSVLVHDPLGQTKGPKTLLQDMAGSPASPLGLSGRGSSLAACAWERKNSPTGSRKATTAAAQPVLSGN